MIVLKIIITPIIIILLSQVWSEFKNSRLGILWFLFWGGAWTSVGLIVYFPQLTTELAHLIGVTRGVDAIIYLSIVTLFYLIFRLYLKIAHLNRRVTELVRDDALKDNG